MKKTIFLSACTLVALIACNQPDTKEATTAAPVSTFSIDSVKQEINAVNEKFGAAFVAGDSATIVSLYTADAEVYPPNMAKANVGGVGSMVKSIPAMGIKKMTLTSVEVSGGPDGVSETGVFDMSDGTKSIDKGKYIVLWKKDGDKWKLHRDIWNSDNPPPPAAPAKK